MFFALRLDCAGHFARTQAARANLQSLRRSVYHCLNRADVGFPGTIAPSVRVADLNAEHNTLAADITLCHLLSHLHTFQYVLYTQHTLLYQTICLNASVFLQKTHFFQQSSVRNADCVCSVTPSKTGNAALFAYNSRDLDGMADAENNIFWEKAEADLDIPCSIRYDKGESTERER